ncbi:T9SS type A sorting domain-containing protein [Echinicola pacifica]|nr:T9SS type A sorting domain-containing protein [Echinicola pacifica]
MNSILKNNYPPLFLKGLWVIVFLSLIGWYSGEALAQRGPGGVGNNDGLSSLIMWYRVDNGISTTAGLVNSWQNSAGIVAHNLLASGVNRPLLVDNVVNTFGEVRFDGNDFLQITGALTTANFVTDQASTFLVTSRNSNSATKIYGTSPLETERFSAHLPWTDGTIYYDFGGCCTATTRIQVGGQANLNLYSIWSYDARAAEGKQLYRNGTQLQNRAGINNYTGHSTQSFRVGVELRGQITELIIFKERLNQAETIIIWNYLNAKYKISLTQDNLYDEDDDANGNYDYDVAGIGRIDASNLHDNSIGTGHVQIFNPSNLTNGEFMLWGHDNQEMIATETIDVPAGVEARFHRIWAISEVNRSLTPVNVGFVDIAFDLNDLMPVTASDLVLLVNNTGSSFAGATVVTGAADLGGGMFGFDQVDKLQDGTYFTLGTINRVETPLPIEWLDFTAKPTGQNSVLIKWKTATEKDNSHFNLLRSVDGKDWGKIAEIEGQGDSDEVRSYQYIDSSAPVGLNYYRLQQVDINGDTSFSTVLRVQLHEEDQGSLWKVFPNPSNGLVMIETNFDLMEEQIASIKVYNTLGHEMTHQIQLHQIDPRQLKFDLSGLPQGLYYLHLPDKTIKLFRQ